jgi:hypothetical protein
MIKGSLTCLHVCSPPLGPKQLLIFGVNDVLCYFPPLVVLQGNVRVFKKNVDKAEMEVRTRMEDFLV